MKKMRTKLVKNTSLIALALCFSSSAWADFIIKSENQSLEPYGNAQTLRFRNAITGTTPLTPEEEALLMDELPESENQRFYGRVSLNSSTLVLDQIRNKSFGIDSTGTIFKKKASKSQLGLELAIGYTWEPGFRGELEYLVNKNFMYTSNPAISTGPSRNLSVEIKSNPLLVDVYYDFSGFDRFRPYVTGGLGLSLNSIKSTLTPNIFPFGGETSKRWVTFAWQVGLGFRVSMFTRWFVDIKYRYIRLGTNLRVEPNANFRVNTNFGMNALSVGVIYLF